MDGQRQGQDQLEGDEIGGDDRNVPMGQSQQPKHYEDRKKTAGQGENNPSFPPEHYVKGPHEQKKHPYTEDLEIVLYVGDDVVDDHGHAAQNEACFGAVGAYDATYVLDVLVAGSPVLVLVTAVFILNGVKLVALFDRQGLFVFLLYELQSPGKH